VITQDSKYLKKMGMMMDKSYSEAMRHSNFEDRFNYLKLNNEVGYTTFGYDRYVNQGFYMTQEWKHARRDVILRDNGCDLAIPGLEIYSDLIVHHINPMSIDDIVHHEDWILDPEYLICTTKKTHNALHFGNESMLPDVVTSRTPNDTRLW
jgi:hypothetical protein